jgi:general secretion pathway protein E
VADRAAEGHSVIAVDAKPILDPVAPSEAFLSLIPRDFARDHLILSQGRAGGVERLLVGGRTDPAAIHNVGVCLGVPVDAEVADDETVAIAIDKAYEAHLPTDAPGLDAPSEDADELDRLLARADRDLLTTDGKGPVVRLVDALLFEALSRHASDVHVQPLEDRVLVRYRIDGVLQTARELPASVANPVVSRIKVMGRMDIAEKRVPQDGRATVTIGAGDRGRPIDLRISTLPTSFGERAVVRLLDTSGEEHLLSFESLGMPQDVLDRYLDRASRSSGIILLTGPTGSGKTTTLYTTLRWLASRGDRGDVNVMTIEDPIEYELSSHQIAISQAQVNAKKGVTFASGLRHILRQDPDVIMVGEVRDAETARIAIQASLTGHLVFSTLHTNDAASAVSRLVDLGVEAYLVSASLSAVLAQRLVRRVHAACSGARCDACFGSGYKGRVGLFELLVVDEGVRERIAAGATASAIRGAARAASMRSLQAEGERLVADGVSTREEVERVVWGLE